MTDRLNMLPRHRAKVVALLREHLPGIEVWAYGSRVNGRSHPGSDLDLVLRGPGLAPIPNVRIAGFRKAYEKSSVPFLVDARDWAVIPESFQREIKQNCVALVSADAWLPT